MYQIADKCHLTRTRDKDPSERLQFLLLPIPVRECSYVTGRLQAIYI